jgi:hypothetical protein
MIQARPIISRPHSSEIEAVNYQSVAYSPIDRILQKILTLARSFCLQILRRKSNYYMKSWEEDYGKKQDLTPCYFYPLDLIDATSSLTYTKSFNFFAIIICMR